MMQDGSSSMGSVPFQDGCSNSSAAYLQRAASAVEAGDRVLGIHLYLAAYERALQEQMVPSDEAIEGMVEAWRLAVDTKQRSLAEYIFEKLEPFWQPDEVARHADELQRMAFDKLEEYGFDRDTIEDVADMVNKDLMEAVPDVLCRFDEQAQPPASAEPAQPAQPAQPSEGAASLADSIAHAIESLRSGVEGPHVVSAPAAQAAPAPSESAAFRMDYSTLVGFDEAIARMGQLGVGRARDRRFLDFIEMLNHRHGLPGIPGLGTFLFRCPAREDADYFMVATAAELDMPAIRMRLDRNVTGQVVLCVMTSPDFKARLSAVASNGFETPTVVILEDLDLWDLPPMDASGDPANMIQVQLSRGAREALGLIQVALNSPDTTVLVSASEPNDIDPFFWDMMGPHRLIDIELPDREERKAVWRACQSQHPSLRGLDVNQLVDFSRTLSRFEIFALANEAVEEAYRRSVADNEFHAVSTDDMLTRLASFQPLDSYEYRAMEDILVDHMRRETSNFDDLLGGR